jgi:hypothetical protein
MLIIVIFAIPNSINSLGDCCFEKCSSLSSLTIPNSVNSLGYACFYGCSSLVSLIIPNSVVEIGIKCFQNCLSLQNFGISFQNLPKIRDIETKKAYPFYSELSSDLFIGCAFKSSLVTH